jgi:hypothetical protein
MRSVIMMAIIGIGLLAATVAAAQADHWPPDLWESLNRERI